VEADGPALEHVDGGDDLEAPRPRFPLVLT